MISNITIGNYKSIINVSLNCEKTDLMSYNQS